MVLPGRILTFGFLNNANISDSHEKLARATITKLSSDTMKEQLQNLLGDLSLSASNSSSSGDVTSQLKV